MNYYGTPLKVYKIHTKRTFNYKKVFKNLYLVLILLFITFIKNTKKRVNNVHKNSIMKIKLFIVAFGRKYFNPDLKYADPLIKQWKQTFVHFLVFVLFNGIVFYISLTAIVYVFPSLSKYIFLGNNVFQVILAIFSLGMAAWFLKKIINIRRLK